MQAGSIQLRIYYGGKKAGGKICGNVFGSSVFLVLLHKLYKVHVSVTDI
jgi:hypothetical protein